MSTYDIETIRKEIVNSPQMCVDGVFLREQLDQIKGCDHIQPCMGRYADKDERLLWNKSRIVLAGRHYVYQFLELAGSSNARCEGVSLDLAFTSHAGIWRESPVAAIKTSNTDQAIISTTYGTITAQAWTILHSPLLGCAAMSIVSDGILKTMERFHKMAFSEARQPPPSHHDFSFHITPQLKKLPLQIP